MKAIALLTMVFLLGTFIAVSTCSPHEQPLFCNLLEILVDYLSRAGI